MSSVVSTKCWLCPETYEKKKDLKSHAISEHSVCRVVCPWCVDSERTFGRMSELTKHSKRKHNDLTIDLLEGDFFTEPNGFWLAKRPDDYVRNYKAFRMDEHHCHQDQGSTVGMGGSHQEGRRRQT
ncbi:Hypothetical predicted protein [Mytilus galloprovincialis]|uniref:C2H2-type domain-containing protein n=1 Tax=Mytilus galloprovincialis TaxID=29158 RepID=A0A8B6G828_MYTGA|nr:Hypothetical predicted protein [Mytilus galloprovincialis]